MDSDRRVRGLRFVVWMMSVTATASLAYLWASGGFARREEETGADLAHAARRLWEGAEPWPIEIATRSQDLAAFFEYQIQHARAMRDGIWINQLPARNELERRTVESYLLAHSLQEEVVEAQRRAVAAGNVRRSPVHTLGGPFLGDGFVVVNGSFPGVGNVVFKIDRDREPVLFPALAELAQAQVALRRLSVTPSEVTGK
jgi:hypothetical protein